MDSMSRLGLSGNSSTASGRIDLGRTLPHSYSLGRRDFFFFMPALLVSLLTLLF